jgi:glucokinase
VSVFAGIDVGGTNIKVLIVSATGRVLARDSIVTRPAQGPDRAFGRVADCVEGLAGGRDIAAAGVGCAGLVDMRRGRLLAAPNLKRWENTPLRRIARRHLGVYTTVDNDATSAAWGEYRRGANRGRRHLVFLTLGTGVGGGVICDGSVVRGAGNFGGEVGHIAVTTDGPRCHCGSRGCLEAYVGTYGLLRRARELTAGRRSRYLSRWVDEGQRLTPRLIMDAARRGDGAGRRVAREMGEHLGVAIASLINIFNPEAVVIGGGVSGSFDLISPHIERVVARRAFTEAARMASIESSTLGNDATAIGAAMYARDSWKNAHP